MLTSKGVEPVRLVVRGFGEQYPIASNDTPSGRAQNRRVEIALSPVVE
nr:OmpA family protein [Kordiimonas gwangyangensis]